MPIPAPITRVNVERMAGRHLWAFSLPPVGAHAFGATLGAILTMGLNQQRVGGAHGLSSGYSLGLGIPFLVMAIQLNALPAGSTHHGLQQYFKIASGIFIIAIGILLLTNTMSLIAIWAFKNGYYINSFSRYAAAPTYLQPFCAKLLSFISPVFFRLYSLAI